MGRRGKYRGRGRGKRPHGRKMEEKKQEYETNSFQAESSTQDDDADINPFMSVIVRLQDKESEDHNTSEVQITTDSSINTDVGTSTTINPTISAMAIQASDEITNENNPGEMDIGTNETLIIHSDPVQNENNVASTFGTPDNLGVSTSADMESTFLFGDNINSKQPDLKDNDVEENQFRSSSIEQWEGVSQEQRCETSFQNLSHQAIGHYQTDEGSGLMHSGGYENQRAFGHRIMERQHKLDNFNASNMDDWLKPSGKVSVKSSNKNSSNSKVNMDSLENAIVKFLQKCQGNKAEANDIARATGFKSKKGVNPTLYGMSRKGVVNKIQESPPLWQLCGMSSNTEFSGAESNMDAEIHPVSHHKRFLSPVSRARGSPSSKRHMPMSAKEMITREKEVNKINHDIHKLRVDSSHTPYDRSNFGKTMGSVNFGGGYHSQTNEHGSNIIESFTHSGTSEQSSYATNRHANDRSMQSNQKTSFQNFGMSSSGGPPPSPAELLKSGGIFGRNALKSNTFNQPCLASNAFHKPNRSDMNISGSRGSFENKPVPLMNLSTSQFSDHKNSHQPLNMETDKKQSRTEFNESGNLFPVNSSVLHMHQHNTSNIPVTTELAQFTSSLTDTCSSKPNVIINTHSSNTVAKVNNPFLPSKKYYKNDNELSSGMSFPTQSRTVNAGNFNPSKAAFPQRAGACSRGLSSSIAGKGPPLNPVQLMEMRGEKPQVNSSFEAGIGMGSTVQRQVNSMQNALFNANYHKSSSFTNTQHTSSSIPTSSLSMNSGNQGSALSSLSSEMMKALNKNPVSTIMEWAQARGTQCTISCVGQRGSSHRPYFDLQVSIGKRNFPPVTVTNKKDGRKDAAEAALKILMQEGSFQVKSEKSPMEQILQKGMQATTFDKIAGLAHQMFNNLLGTISETLPGKKVIAALIMKRGPMDEGIVISLGTGNRCITGQFMSLEGSTVNDSHAEIITRRCFVRYMYEDLLKHKPDTANSMFTRGNNGKFRVKDGLSFHLYISTAPCGDGALFSPADADKGGDPVGENEDHRPTFTSKVQGILRTKIENGEGTIPIDSDHKEQTWDGILRGERLRTMSCSDKICRWNLLGMQGALLSHFLEPVYLNSLTLGLLYNHSHLSRATCCRLIHDDPNITPELPPGYQVNHPKLGRVTLVEESRETQKTKEHALSWCIGDPKAEVMDGTKGSCIDKPKPYEPALICKANLYKLFKQVCRKYNRPDLLQSANYTEAKNKAGDFQAAKKLLFKKFKKTGYGNWVQKPVEEGMFT